MGCRRKMHTVSKLLDRSTRPTHFVCNKGFFLLVKWCLLTHNVNTLMKPIRYLTPYSSTDFVVQHMSLNCNVKKTIINEKESYQ